MIIKNEKLKRAILTALSDKDMIKVLNSSKDDLMSVNMIMQKFDIPHSTAYRKIKWMLDNELLVVEKMKFSDDGKKFSLFRSTIGSVNVKYENEVIIEAVRNANISEDIAMRFFSLEDYN